MLNKKFITKIVPLVASIMVATFSFIGCSDTENLLHNNQTKQEQPYEGMYEYGDFATPETWRLSQFNLCQLAGTMMAKLFIPI